MKSFFAFAIILMAVITVSAQQPHEAGAVPVINGKVTFEETIPATGMYQKEVKNIIDTWVKERFVKPTVISRNSFSSEQPETVILKSEEYITFKSAALVLDRARIYYFLTLTANDGSCTFNMSRITYWYDDEDEKGGLKMKAEEWITDENALNKKGKLKKFEGKFRRKTIELKEKLVKDLEYRLKTK